MLRSLHVQNVPDMSKAGSRRATLNRISFARVLLRQLIAAAACFVCANMRPPNNHHHRRRAQLPQTANRQLWNEMNAEKSASVVFSVIAP